MRKLLVVFYFFSIQLASISYAGWTEPIEIPGTDGGQVPEAIAIGDTIHVVSDVGNLFIYVRSTDRGATWSQPVYPIADTNYDCYNPHIIWSGGKLHITCIGFHPTYQFRQVYEITSRNAGRTWSSPHHVFTNFNPMLIFAVATGVADTLFLCCRQGFTLTAFKSTNAGSTWERRTDIVPSGATINQRQYLFLKDNRLHAIYPAHLSSMDSTTYEIYYQVSYDQANNWESPIPLSTAEHVPNQIPSQIPTATIDSDGRMVVLWMDYKYGSLCGFTGDILGRYSSDNGTSWGPELRLTQDQGGEGSS